jgi:hypothetical protein
VISLYCGSPRLRLKEVFHHSADHAVILWSGGECRFNQCGLFGMVRQESFKQPLSVGRTDFRMRLYLQLSSV